MSRLRALQSETNSKNPKTNWIELTPPTHPQAKLLFWKPITDMNRTLKS